MHLHSCHQPGGSMEGHIYNAKKLGMQYIHFTDHDTRMGRKQKQFDYFDFSKGVLEYSDYPNATVGFDVFGKGKAQAEIGKIVFEYTNAEKGVQKSGLKLRASGKRQSVSLLSNLCVRLGMKFQTKGDAKVVIDILLSQRPPEYKEAHLKYVFSPHGEEPLTKYVQKEINPDGLYILEVSKDCAGCDEIGGLDNAFSNISFTVECGESGSATIQLFSLEMKSEIGFQSVLEKQRVLAKQIGDKYGVEPFVTMEISGAGQHKNVFSSCVPMIDYYEKNYAVTEEESVAHIQKYNGVFSYNHPFDNARYAKISLDGLDVDELIENEAKRLIENNVYGATLIEVGFIEGKRQFNLMHHLKLWDLLSLNGVFITGEGNSDSHHNDSGWFGGQNCASWIATPAHLQFPISEEVFIQSMKAGRLYFGDPIFLTFPISFSCGKTQMGGIIKTKNANDTFLLKFQATNVPKNYEIRVVVNGDVAQKTITQKNVEEVCIALKACLSVNFARVEMYNEAGRCILLTNPIYAVREDLYSQSIPLERIYE